MLRDLWRSLEDGAPVWGALRTVVVQAASALGDHAVLRLLSEDGVWVRTVEVAHADPTRAAEIRGVFEETPQRASSWACWPAVLRGRTVHLAAVEPGRLLQRVPNGFGSYVDRHATGSVVIAPVSVAGEVVGALGVVRERRRPFEPVDVEAVEHLAREAGLAVDNARLVSALGAEAARREGAERWRARDEAWWRSLIEGSSDLVLVVDPLSLVTYASPASSELLGVEPAELVGRPVTELLLPLDPAEEGDADEEGGLAALRAGGEPRRRRVRHADGTARTLEVRSSALAAGGAGGGWILNGRDVTEAVAAEDALRRSERRFRAVVRHASDIIVMFDAEGRVRYVSPAAGRLLGYGDELAVPHVFALVHPDDRDVVVRDFQGKVDADHGPSPITFRIAHRDGSWRHVEAVGSNQLDDPDLRAILVTLRDVTERVAAEQDLAHQATHDALTGLPNRTLLLDRLSLAIARAARSGNPVAVLFLDLDRFKVMNDALGHEAGDEILRAVAERLLGAVRPSDTVARIGGDEFVVVVEGLEVGGDGREVAARVESALARPVAHLEHTLHVSASIGVVVADATSSASELLRDADAAMYLAKDAGRARSVWFTADLRRRAADRLELETELRRALDEGTLDVHYQVEVDLADGRPMGAEALVRWHHPERGPLGPDRFISMAEETGLIWRVGDLVLDRACAEAARWGGERAAAGRWMGVNVSAAELARPGFARGVADAVARHGLPRGRLCLEITESVLMWDPNRAAEVLAELRASGVTIAVDDFGTGYSSLNYLKRFPVDFVKVDREFVSGLGVDDGDAAIVRAVTEMSHALGLAVVAEGVETPRQRDQLVAMGCDYAQGWLYGQPVSAEELRGRWWCDAAGRSA